MTIGEKIRKYRSLKGWTQKQLGAATEKLKSKTNAGVRINQYESVMVPGDDMRESIAKALGVDIEALSDVDLRTDEDYMFALFEMEEKYGLRITKEDGKIHLIIDNPDNENNNEQLITYLNFWKNEASKERSTDEDKLEYELWKARFASDIKKYFKDKETAIDELYGESVEALYKEKKYAKETPEVSRLLKQIVDAGLFLSTRYGDNLSAGYSFNVNEILNPSTEDVKELFARFLLEIKNFKELGAYCYTELSLPEDALIITYFVDNPELQIIKAQIDKYIKAIKIPNRPDWVVEKDNEDFEIDLKVHHNNIEDSIKSFLGKK